ncbi:transcriptional regulator NrdR [Hydrogenophilus thiooxidans]|uniref:transcriptional regulator NrdR n=1 Tax=Hydrogenophilus thiooxidans TaxID=2820326 RepID=UPI001C24FEE7|nr:transcriptional regulator NrdR [Hydrogenophilus thiooxidans]
MRCPFCSAPDTQVLETRDSADGAVIRRRRRCAACGRRFTTFERAEIKLPAVIKRNGAREPYQREKLRASFELALRKRPVSNDAIDAAIDAIEAKLLASGASEIASDQLGEWAMDALKSLDKIGYVRFASVYRNFEDVDAFAQFLRNVKPRRRKKGAKETHPPLSEPGDLFAPTPTEADPDAAF